MGWRQLSILFVITVILGMSLVLATSVDRVVQGSATPGNTVPVRFNVVMNQGESYYVLNDKIPNGWDVLSEGNGNVGADGIWRLTVNPASSSSGVEGYDLIVPAGASGSYSFLGNYGTVGGSSSSGSIGGSSSLSVSGPGTVISLTPSSQSVEAGDTFTVDVNISGPVGLYGVQFDLSFDDNLLNLQGVESSDELLIANIGSGSVTGSDLLGDPYYVADSGLVDDFVVLRSGVATGVTSSGGKIATFTFTTSSSTSGSINLALQNVMLVSFNGSSLSYTTQGATVEVGYCGDGIPQTGLGEVCDDGNVIDGDGCSSMCTQLSCAAQGGDICSDTEICSGSSVSSADSALCCSVSCSPPSHLSCTECGDGLFNWWCDRLECQQISEGCFFIDDGTPFVDSGTCEGCSGATCGDYSSDQVSCGDDVCGFAPPTCVFDTGNNICDYAQTEIDCTNGADDDGDGLVDCEDSDCFGLEGPNVGVMCCGDVADCDNGLCTIESCVSNQCVSVNRPQGDYAECGECQACDSAGGSCAPVALAAEGAGCTGECSYCVTGVCTDRSQHDFAECSGECEACTGILGGGSCQSDTHTQGSQCLDPGKYCSSGNCCNDLTNGVGDDFCDSCSLDQECDSPYSCAVGVCSSGSCIIDITGCDCARANTNGDINGDVNVIDLSFIVLNPGDPKSDVDGIPGVNIGDLVFVATRIGICEI